MSRLGNLGARLYRGEVGYDFVGKRKIWYGISILITITAIVGLAVRGLNMGIEFQGGAVFTTAEDQRLGQPGRDVRGGGLRPRRDRPEARQRRPAHPDRRPRHRASPTEVKEELAKDLKVDPDEDQRRAGRPQLG